MNKALLKHECRQLKKTMLIWSLAVGLLGLLTIAVFSSLQGDMEQMSEQFAKMGAFADAVGMNKMSIGTIEGYYAVEVSVIFGLGGAMFAASVAINMLSKEEGGHTGEFLYATSVSRGGAVATKFAAVLIALLTFTVICLALFGVGFLILGAGVPLPKFTHFHAMQLLMNVEVAAICFAISAYTAQNLFGLGIGLVLVLYFSDMMARVVPSLEILKTVSPYGFACAADIFSDTKIEPAGIVLGVICIIVALTAAVIHYRKKDLAA